MPLTAQQKAVVQQFTATTGATQKIAERYLKSAGYNLQIAANQYFEHGGASPAPSSAKNDAKLEQMFESLRDPKEDTTKDEVGAATTMKYIENLGADLESCELFIVLEIVQAPGLGIMRKKGFVDGWKATGVNPTATAQMAYIKQQKAALSQDIGYFRKVYRAAFASGKEENLKAIPLDTALIYWDMVFSPPGLKWETQNVNWLATWKEFLGEKWTRSVNRDMWNQTLEFAIKSLGDESLSFWSENGAWPGVIDDFVAWWKERQAKAGVMETD